MKDISKIQVWMAQTRANFLLLAVFLVAIGLAYAAKYYPGQEFSWINAALILAGTISAHISVNLFNELSDYYTKIDFLTKRTPFSGGSGMLIQGRTKPWQVKAAAITTLLIAAAIGAYFTMTAHWSIAIISLIGAFTIVFYTSTLAKVLLGELFAGLALGTLVVVGSFIAMTGSAGTGLLQLVPLEVWLVSIPPGILTSLLLLLNEFPDVEADKEGGRKHLVIKFGKKLSAGIYTAGMTVTFLILLMLPLLGIASFWLYLALIPLPVAFKASQIALNQSESTEKMVPAMGMNVMVVLGTDLLIAVAVLLQI